MTSGRIVLATMTVCCLLYGLAIFALANAVRPQGAGGSLVLNGQGEIVGSALIAQGFSRPEHFWPRPSAVGYNASAAGGSNWSPTNPELRQRAMAALAGLGATQEKPVPADLVAASGSGLDPHITLKAARYQAQRVAAASGLPLSDVLVLIEKYAKRAGGPLTPEPLVNVLLLNLALDRMKK